MPYKVTLPDRRDHPPHSRESILQRTIYYGDYEALVDVVSRSTTTLEDFVQKFELEKEEDFSTVDRDRFVGKSASHALWTILNISLYGSNPDPDDNASALYYRMHLNKTEESRVLRQFGKNMGFELTADMTAESIFGLLSNVERKRTKYAIHPTFQRKIREMAERAEGDALSIGRCALFSTGHNNFGTYVPRFQRTN